MKILFVCSGNTCRSPLAEAIARKVAADRGLSGVKVSSAGTGAWNGSTASDGSLLIAMERGMELSSHQSRKLTREMIRDNDLILSMTPSHLRSVNELGREDAANKSYLLTEYASRGVTREAIDDPFGESLESYRLMADRLETEINNVFDRLAEETRVTGQAPK